MPEEVEVPQGQIPEGEDKGEGVSEEWGRGHPEAAMEVHGCDGLPDPIPPGQGDHLQPPAWSGPCGGTE